VERTAVAARLIRRLSSGSGVLELYDLRVYAGEVANAHAHPAGVLEHVLVSSGRLLTGPEQQTAELGPGDYMSVRAEVPHTYVALDGGDVVGTLIMDYPPAIGLPGCSNVRCRQCRGTRRHSLITVTALVALYRTDQITFHLRRAPRSARSAPGGGAPRS
jgi:hypothetical protein